ncbi:MAG: hypothetical protein ACI3Y0_11875 [Prevotella sp.]
MGNRKVTPLKDEPGTSLEELQIELSNCIQTINALSGKIDTLAKPTAIDPSALKDAVGKAAANEVRILLEARQRKFNEEEEAAKAKGEITQQEYFQTLTERYEDVLTKCIALVDFNRKQWPGLVNKCEETVRKVGEQSKHNSESLTKITSFINKVAGEPHAVCLPPSLPKSKQEVIPFLKQYLLYVVKRLCHSRHVRKLIRLCVYTSWIVTVGTLLFVANDNAKLRTVEKKYILLRDFSRLDERTSKHSDYIEWLYSDEDEHRQEIEKLWQKRQERLNDKKQK